MPDKPRRWTRKARRHKIGRAHAEYVMDTVTPGYIEATDDLDGRYEWVGTDITGRELEITAIDLPDFLLVIHVMPTAFRSNP